MAYLIQTLIPMTTNVPADVVTNSWHFGADSDSDAVTASASLKTFYNAIIGHYPSTVSQTGWRFKIFDLEDPQPRAPVAEETWTTTGTPAGQTLPSECAMVLSFQALRTSGVPQARFRNRVFIGPLDTALVGADGRFTSGAMTTLATAAAALLTASDSAPAWSWRTSSSFSADTNFPVDNGWVDNAVDVQRRRGIKATTRTLWS
jgi:hypothetical protein